MQFMKDLLDVEETQDQQAPVVLNTVRSHFPYTLFSFLALSGGPDDSTPKGCLPIIL